MLSKIIFAIILSSLSVNIFAAKELTKRKELEIKLLIQKEYCVASFSEGQIKVLNGKKIENVTSYNFFQGKYYQCDDNTDINEVHERVIDRYEDDELIIFKKNKKLYTFKNAEFKKFTVSDRMMIDKEERNRSKRQNVKEALFEIQQCAFCQFRLSSNYISIESRESYLEGSTQYSSELSWAPYYSFSRYNGLTLTIGASSYLIENDDLEEEISYALKYQMLYRVYVGNFFAEAGGGVHDFISYDGASLMYTANIGYVFQRRFWFLTERVGFKNIFFSASKINWDLDILEYKMGVGINF